MSVAALEINLTQLSRVADATPSKSIITPDGAQVTTTRVVSEEVLKETGARYEGCRCDELGLAAGMLVTDLIELGSGCTGETIDGRKVHRVNSTGWVCQRLDLVRRRYGK